MAEDSDLVRVSRLAVADEQLSAEGRVQQFLFQQFLMLYLLAVLKHDDHWRLRLNLLLQVEEFSLALRLLFHRVCIS